MISSRQIKAARALLGWKQADLAKACGLHINAINKIETDQGEPRSSSLEKIQAACEEAGVHFRGQRGVELKEDVFELARFDGPSYIRRLTDEIMSVANTRDAEVLSLLTDEHLFNQADEAQAARYAQHVKKTGLRERYLTDKSCSRFRRADSGIYRWLPKETLGTVAFVVYGNRTAFINWRVREILIVKSVSLSTSFRAQFDFLWQQASPFSSSGRDNQGTASGLAVKTRKGRS